MQVMSAVSSNTHDAFYYTSAPTSPRRCNFNGFYFLSMPTSPTRLSSRDLSGSKFGSRTPETSPLFPDYFEFEGSKRFCVYDNRYETSHNFSIAYADELFCDGKMPPLRPPPRAQYTRPNKVHGVSSTASSPGARARARARGWTLRVPFARQRSLWNDGFDPFMAALNKVKVQEENDVVNTREEKAQLRRSKSLSPFRWPIGSARWTTHKNKILGLRPQPEELGPMFPDAFGPREVVGRSHLSESRKQKMKEFLVKNAAFNGEKGEPSLVRKTHNTGSNCNAITRISREMKTLMKHRARVLLCLVKGFGTKKCKKSESKL